MQIISTSNPPVGYSKDKVDKSYDALTKSQGSSNDDWSTEDLW